MDALFIFNLSLLLLPLGGRASVLPPLLPLLDLLNSRGEERPEPADERQAESIEPQLVRLDQHVQTPSRLPHAHGVQLKITTSATQNEIENQNKAKAEGGEDKTYDRKILQQEIHAQHTPLADLHGGHGEVGAVILSGRGRPVPLVENGIGALETLEEFEEAQVSTT